MKVYYFMLTWHGRLHLYVYDLSTWHKVPHNYLILCNDTRIDIIAWPNFSWLLLCIFFFMGQNSINIICFTLLFVNVYLIIWIGAIITLVCMVFGMVHLVTFTFPLENVILSWWIQIYCSKIKTNQCNFHQLFEVFGPGGVAVFLVFLSAVDWSPDTQMAPDTQTTTVVVPNTKQGVPNK